MAKGNSDYLTWDAQLRFDFKHRMYHTFLVVEIKQGEQHEERFLNKGFMHGRAVRTFSPGVAAEVFAQIEYDGFIKLRERKLAGAGARIRLLKTKTRVSIFLGAGFMREHELYSNPLVRSKLLSRSSNYMTGRYKFDSIFSFSFTSYYQPDVKQFSDYRILVQSGFSVKLAKNFSLNTSLEYRFDNEPMTDIKKYDVGITNGITARF